MTDRFSRDALGNFVDGETLLDWIQRNPSNPGALFLLLTKLEEVGALLVGRAIGPPAFSFGEEERTDSSRTGATIPATPKQTSRRIAEISDNPLLVEAASSPGAGEAASARGDSAGWDSDFEEEPSEDDGDLEPPSPTADLPDVGLLDDSPLAGEASPGLEPVLEGYLEGAGFAASLHRLRTTGEQESVEEDSWEEGAGWRESVHRFLDRGDWDAARRELQTRLIEAPEDTEAAAFEAWLAFSRAVEGGPSSTGEALAELERVLEAAPSCGATYHLLGLAALTLGNPKQARAHFDRGLEAVPEDRAMLVATALVRTGYYDHPRADLSPAGVWRLTRKLAK